VAFVVLTFALVTGVVLGVYYLFILRPETDTQSALKKRIGKVPTTGLRRELLLNPEERLSDLSYLDALLFRFRYLIGPVERTIVESGLKVKVGTVLLACMVAGALGFALTYRFTALFFASVVVGGLAAFIPIGYVRHVRTKRVLKFEEQFPEAIDLLGRSLRAGHALTTGLGMVAAEMGDPIGTEFRLIFDRQNYGAPLPDALRAFATRVPLMDAKFFVTAVLTQRESGGNLAEVLDNLAAIIRERFRVKRQVRVISAHGRITGWVLTGLPPSLGLAFMFITPETYRMFYTDPLGIQMIVVALILQVIGAIVIRRIVDIEY
jgi:tight adherence protein B